MAINFPSAPTVNDLYVFGSPPRTWRWNGEGWERVVNAGQIVAFLIVVQPYVEVVATAMTFVPNDMYTFTYL